MANFYESLESGKITENVVLSHIKKEYPKAYVVEGYCKEYDIYVPEKKIGIEVKRDEKSKYTGNYVIEIEFDGKPSALSTTKAEYWVIFDGKFYIWILTNKLKAMVESFGNKYLAEFIGNGDTKYKKAYLVPKKIIKDKAKLIITGDKNEL